MSLPNKRPHSPEASNSLPQKRTRISARARQGIPPRMRRRGPKDDPIFALKKIEKRRRYPILSAVPRQQDTLQSIQVSPPPAQYVVPTVNVESQQPHQHILPIAVPNHPLSPPPNDHIGVDKRFKNILVRPDTKAQSGSHTAASVLQNNGTLLHQTSHLDRPSSSEISVAITKRHDEGLWL